LKTPIVGDLPFIGAAFSSKAYTETEEEVIILMTPHLVDAADCHQMEGKLLPGQETRSPDDFELFLEGILEAPRGPRDVCVNHHYVPAYKNGPTSAVYPCAGGKGGHGGAGGCGCAGGNAVAPEEEAAPVTPHAPVLPPAAPAAPQAVPAMPQAAQPPPRPAVRQTQWAHGDTPAGRPVELARPVTVEPADPSAGNWPRPRPDGVDPVVPTVVIPTAPRPQ